MAEEEVVGSNPALKPETFHDNINIFPHRKQNERCCDRLIGKTYRNLCKNAYRSQHRSGWKLRSIG